LQDLACNIICPGRILFLVNGAGVLVDKFDLVNEHRCREQRKENTKHKPNSNYYFVRGRVKLLALHTNDAHHAQRYHVRKVYQAYQENIHVEQNELFMIPPADAVAHPRTVVVHSDYAPLTLSAMMGSRWLYRLTVDACFE